MAEVNFDQSFQIPLIYNFAGEVSAYAERNPDKNAIITVNEAGESKSYTYRELIDRTNRIGNGLRSLGLGRGDKVLVIVPRGVEAYTVYLALNKIGAVILPCSEMLRVKDIEYRANHADAKAVIAYAGVVKGLEGLRPHCPTLLHYIQLGGSHTGWLSLDELTAGASESLVTVQTSSDELAFLSYTSGTTGGPKGVMHVHGWPYAHLSVAATHWLDVREDDLVWATAGPGWAKWIWSPFVSTLGKGATVFLYEGKFSA